MPTTAAPFEVPNSGATEHNTRFLSSLDGSPPPVSMPQAAAALARNGDVAGLREALASGSPLAGLLHIAAEERHVEILEVLVEAGAPLDELMRTGRRRCTSRSPAGTWRRPRCSLANSRASSSGSPTSIG